MITSPFDRRQYQTVTLDNHIELLWVIDKQTPHSVLSLTVGCGNFADPDDIPGLMHLMEHLFFCGSQHYPVSGELLTWIESLPGSINAWTSPEYTNFSLSCPNAQLIDATSRLVDALVSPLFSEASIKSEIQAIDAEFKAKQKEENRRIQEVHKDTCNEKHPFSRFSVGNADTFGKHTLTHLHNVLIEKHRSLYCSEKMKVVIALAEEDKALMAELMAILSTIPVREKSDFPSPKEPLHSKVHLARFISIRPIKNMRQLVLSFDISGLNTEPVNFAEPLLSHLIGHESQGSLLHLWKKLGWATQILVGVGLEGNGFREFNINIQLSEAGERHLKEIAQCVFHYLRLIKNGENVTAHWSEKKTLNALAIEQLCGAKPVSYCQQFSLNMHHFATDFWIIGQYALADFNNEEFHQMLDLLSPKNLRMILVSPETNTRLTTRYYQTSYDIAPLPDDVAVQQQEMQTWYQMLSLPRLNRYIPDLNQVEPRTQPIPSLVASKAPHRIFVCSNNQLGGSRGEAFISFQHSRSESQTLSEMAKRKLAAHILQAQCNEHFYDASIAGCYFNIYAHQTGLGIHTSGFSDKQLQLLLDLIDALYDTDNIEQDFELHRTQYVASLQNSMLHKPLNQLFSQLQCVIVKGAYQSWDLAQKLIDITPNDINQAKETIVAQSCAEALVFGDWSCNELDEFVTAVPLSLNEYVKTTPSHRSVLNLVDIAENSLSLSVAELTDNTVVMYMQGLNDSLEEQAMLMLTESLLSGFYFNWMRTQRNIGYNLGSGYLPFNDYPGLSLYVQSPTHSVSKIYQESINCFAQFCQWIEQFPKEAWNKHKQNLTLQLTNPNVSLSIKCQRLWHSIGQKDLEFNRLERLANHIIRLQPSDINEYVAKRLSTDKPFFVLHTGLNEHEETPHWASTPLTDLYRYK